MIDRRGLVFAISASLIVGCAIGLIAGVLFARATMFRPGPDAPRVRRGVPRQEMTMRFLERRLDLSGEQAERLARIIERTRAGSDSMHDRAHDEIFEVLTPEQRERWDRMNRRMFHGRRGHDRMGPPDRRGPPPPDEP